MITHVERTPTNKMSYGPVQHPRVSCLLTIGWFSDYSIGEEEDDKEEEEEGFVLYPRFVNASR